MIIGHVTYTTRVKVLGNSRVQLFPHWKIVHWALVNWKTVSTLSLMVCRTFSLSASMRACLAFLSSSCCLRASCRSSSFLAASGSFSSSPPSILPMSLVAPGQKRDAEIGGKHRKKVNICTFKNRQLHLWKRNEMKKRAFFNLFSASLWQCLDNMLHTVSPTSVCHIQLKNYMLAVLRIMCRRGSLSLLEASWKTRQKAKSQLETLQRPTETEEDIFFPLLPAICQHYLCLLILPGRHPLCGCICCISICSRNYTEFTKKISLRHLKDRGRCCSTNNEVRLSEFLVDSWKHGRKSHFSKK